MQKDIFYNQETRVCIKFFPKFDNDEKWKYQNVIATWFKIPYTDLKTKNGIKIIITIYTTNPSK